MEFFRRCSLHRVKFFKVEDCGPLNISPMGGWMLPERCLYGGNQWQSRRHPFIWASIHGIYSYLSFHSSLMDRQGLGWIVEEVQCHPLHRQGRRFLVSGLLQDLQSTQMTGFHHASEARMRQLGRNLVILSFMLCNITSFLRLTSDNRYFVDFLTGLGSKVLLAKQLCDHCDGCTRFESFVDQCYIKGGKGDWMEGGEKCFDFCLSELYFKYSVLKM